MAKIKNEKATKEVAKGKRSTSKVSTKKQSKREPKRSSLDKKEASALYGTWFSLKATPAELIAKCDERLELLEVWKQNITSFKEKQEALIIEQKKNEMNELISSMSDDEKAELLTLLNSNKDEGGN